MSASRPRAAALTVLALVVAVGGAAAQTLPTLTAPVNDLAGVIDASSAGELDRRIRSLQQATGDVVVVATVPSIAPYATIEEYAVTLFEQAGIGQKQKDNGVLIVVSVGDRKVRIEVGYGLEEFVTDGFSGETIRQAMLPAFREERYGAGILDGATRVIQRIAQGRGVTLQDVPPVRRDAPTHIPIGTIIVLVFVGLHILGRIVRGTTRGVTGRRRRGPWSGWYGGPFGGGGFGGGGFGGGGFGGGGGGGFGGFGGGRSGGGGASGGW